jgi:hypothetical protein
MKTCMWMDNMQKTWISDDTMTSLATLSASECVNLAIMLMVTWPWRQL